MILNVLANRPPAARAVIQCLFVLLTWAIIPAATAQPQTKDQPQAQPQTQPVAAPAQPVTIRVATFNIEDLRTDDLETNTHPRARAIAEVIQRLRPNIILLNELAYDMPGAPGFQAGAAPGQNAKRFIELYLNTPQVQGLTPIKYVPFMASVNTGVPSGLDLNKDGKVVKEFPAPPAAASDGSPGEQTEGGRAFGNDCWGFGTFPGQYGMALLVDERLTIEADKARTFQRFPWDYLPGAHLPRAADGSSWFSQAEKDTMRLSSKSHWDVPVKLPNGAVLHMLCSHPTPPAFDGPEERNKRRNHDEIRFWADYIANAYFIVDDKAVEGGLNDGANFVLAGDLNADPDEGSSYRDPIGRLIRPIQQLNFITPTSDLAIPGLDPDDTAMFKMRVDYVLPSRHMEVVATGVFREVPTLAPKPGTFPSDHFPVWVDITVDAP